MRKITGLLLCLLLLWAVPAAAEAEETPKTEFLTYPPEAITAFDEAMLQRGAEDDLFKGNVGYEETGLFVSPYYTCTVNGQTAPVYASLCYDYERDLCVLQSFCTLWVTPGTPLEVVLNAAVPVQSGVILPSRRGVDCDARDNTVSFCVNKSGSYTLLINGDDQRYVFTLFVKDYTDEAAEIRALKEKYGEEKVKVFPKGRYDAEYIDVSSYDAVYFERGSFFHAVHRYEIRDEEAMNSLPPRRAFFEFSGKQNGVVTGFGTFDFTPLDRKEREGALVQYCSGCTVEGLCLLNCPSWTFICYGCTDMTVRDITVTGYRTNSDGLDICGCSGVTVSDCFVRTGDDAFSVKTTNTAYEANDITFHDCVAFSPKARCFGITGEVASDIHRIRFTACDVIYRNAVWDHDRVYALAVAAETGTGSIDTVVFEDIEIYRDTGRPLACLVYGTDITNCRITGVTFRNIAVNGQLKGKLCTSRSLSFGDKVLFGLARFLNRLFPGNPFSALLKSWAADTNYISAAFENVTFNGKPLTGRNVNRYLEIEGNADIEVK